MKFCILLSAVLVLSKLYRADSEEGGQCVDLDTDFGEYDELDCTKYNGFADYCGDYADNAEEMCCACGGGKIIQPVEREKLSNGKACDSLDNVPCSTCAKYLDGKKRRKALESEAAKCVWLPEINGCKTKAFAEKKGKTYVEICPEKDPEDECSKFDGILHKHRAVCCNKKCQKCGGVEGKCGELTDEEGKVLGNSQCCGKRIEETGVTCGSDGSKAPCKLSTPRK